MSKLEVSMDRFSKALDLLEARLVRQSKYKKSSNEISSDIERDLAALREDRERLAEELGTVKAEAQVLEGLTAEVSDKLNATINEIRDVLAA